MVDCRVYSQNKNYIGWQYIYIYNKETVNSYHVFNIIKMPFKSTLTTILLQLRKFNTSNSDYLGNIYIYIYIYN